MSSVAAATPYVTEKICVYKADVDQKIGISFCAYEEFGAPVQVRSCADGGLAARSGLLADDILLSINGVVYEDALAAARTLRESHGEIWLCVERQISCSTGDDDDDEEEETESGLSPPRRLFSPPKTLRADRETAATDDDGKWIYDESQAEQPAKKLAAADECDETEDGEEEYDFEEEDEEDERCASSTAEEWQEWLTWMLTRIEARESELIDLQQSTADELAISMREECEEPPEPPSEADFANPAAMEAYMEAMAAYSMRQQAALQQSEAQDAMDDNREATAAIAILASRRQELQACLERVCEMTEEDAARVEEIWRELAHEGSDDEGSGEEEYENGDADEEPEEDVYSDDDDLRYGTHADRSPSAARPAAAAHGKRWNDGDADNEVDRILMGAEYKPQPVRVAKPAQASSSAKGTDGHGDAASLRALTAIGNDRKLGGSFSQRVVSKCESRGGSLVAQRLQRARSSGGFLGRTNGSSSLEDPWVHEVGVKVTPM